MTPEEAGAAVTAAPKCAGCRAARLRMCSFGLVLHDRDSTPRADRSTTLALSKAFGTRRDALGALNSLYSLCFET